MWVISGPFDGEVTGEVGFQSRISLSTKDTNDLIGIEPKLLKTGTKYVLGRKQRKLVINHKKISHDHTEFVVGAYSQGDVVRNIVFGCVKTIQVIID
jgi:hypothetical protein